MEGSRLAVAVPCGCLDAAASGGRPSVVRGGVLRRLESAVLRWRMATARYRVLPDFVIVGAQKSGTTSLYAWLAGDPHVLPASSKELHFVDTCAWGAGLDGYRSHFPLKVHLRLARLLRRGRVITGEATPYYLYHPLAAERLHEVAPAAKIIIVLRDPAGRSLSHYWHEVRGGREDLPLLDALRAEDERLRGREEAIAAGDPPCWHLEHRTFSYQDRSRYARQVARYLELFGREQVLVLKSEELFGDDDDTKARLADFLGIPVSRRPFVAENVGGRHRRDPQEAEIRRLLAVHLADDQERLRALVGERFTW